MATSYKNLSDYDRNKIPSVEGLKAGIVVAEWNHEITDSLLDGACKTLVENGVIENDIIVRYVPGSFELPLGAQFMLDYTDVDIVICIGCVIQGETKHFDYICSSVSSGITRLTLDYGMPVIFGVLTTNTQQQAIDRAGGKLGNKGVEAAVTALKMYELETKFDI